MKILGLVISNLAVILLIKFNNTPAAYILHFFRRLLLSNTYFSISVCFRPETFLQKTF